ncbi:HET domain containing protein [Colletotrichum incanum]|nr:HET domain containing protein [Colletotrichum incanum]
MVEAMWLINVGTLQLEAFYEPDFLYAILSHKWGNEKEPQRTHLGENAGWSKIHYACRVPKSFQLAYTWVDTCCIDITSGAELSEAIGSTLRCNRPGGFIRGLFLQELIVSKTVIFDNAAWHLLGTRKAYLYPFKTPPALMTLGMFPL